MFYTPMYCSAIGNSVVIAAALFGVLIESVFAEMEEEGTTPK